MVVSQQISPSALRAYKLSKYANGQPGNMLLEAKRVKRVTSQFMSKSGAKEAAKRMKALKKTAANAKKVQDAFFKKMPGGATPKNSGLAGGQLLGIVLQGGLAAAVIHSILVQNFINDTVDRQFINLNNDLSKNLTLLTTLNSRVKNLDARVNEFNRKITKELDANAKDYARLNKQTETIAKNAVDAKKQSNDALYETRKGREIVEKKINDNLYESRAAQKEIKLSYAQLKANFDKYISNLNTGFQSKIEVTVRDLQKSLELANQNIKKTNEQVSLQQKTINVASNITKALPASLNTAFKAVQDTTKKVLESNIIPIQKSTERWGVSITPATVTPATVTVSESGGVTVTPSTGGFAKVTYADFSSSDIAREINAESKKQDGQISALAGGLSAVANGVVSAQNTANLALTEARKKGVSFSPDVTTLKTDVDKLKTDINSTKTDLVKIDTKLKEQEKVNASALPKLDSILGMLPLIPARAAAAIRPDIPTIPQIETAAATGTCRTTQPGGCMRKALDDNAVNINQNTNNRINALDIANTGANGALLIGQQTILTRLGNQLPGGIGGKLSRFAEWMHLDRVLNVMTFGATVHNGLMLSNDIGQTFFGIINNVLQLVGLKKEDGSAFDIGSVISSSIENLIKGAIGAENYINLTTTWAKANRIYQASTNILNSFQSLTSTVLSGLELVAGQTGKIGNALRASGEVLESAYQWMNPQPKINRVTNFLERLQNGASTIQQVTQVPLDTINAITELQTANTEFIKAIKEDDKPENKGAAIEEPVKLAESNALAKELSKGLELLGIDLEADED